MASKCDCITVNILHETLLDHILIVGVQACGKDHSIIAVMYMCPQYKVVVRSWVLDQYADTSSASKYLHISHQGSVAYKTQYTSAASLILLHLTTIQHHRCDFRIRRHL
mmetsp:Transcript_81031/g.194393  ORF Transcript_81031/g.194393 Transcript_81031/m.194393 type:complete len:109 (-) Transcript_81031:308-634(-)